MHTPHCHEYMGKGSGFVLLLIKSLCTHQREAKVYRRDGFVCVCFPKCRSTAIYLIESGV